MITEISDMKMCHRLHIFAVTVEQGSITGAAEKLKLSQPAVTLAIRKLEEAAGMRLLNRNMSGAAQAPTDAGKIVAKRANQIQVILDKMKGELAA
jgi:DNA-binding transcriptional LysR family regulator